MKKNNQRKEFSAAQNKVAKITGINSNIFSGSFLGKLFTPNTYFRAKVNDIRLQELNGLMSALHMVPDQAGLDHGLGYFRQCYQCLPFQYPGDFIFYEMVTTCIKKGLSLDRSLLLTRAVIDREVENRRAADVLGFNYQENWEI